MTFAFISVLALYLVATLLYILRLLTGYKKLSAIALRVTVLAALEQSVVLGLHFSQLPRPWILTYLEYFQLSALVLSVLFIILCFTRRFYGSGPFFITLIDVFCIMSLTLDSPNLELTHTRGFGYLSIHLTSIFLSLSIFSIAMVAAIMFLLSEWQIKHKRFEGMVARFPSLAVLDQVHYKSLLMGFAIFTLAIFTGAGYSKMTSGHYISTEPKQILSFLSWGFFAILLNFRFKKGWQGHKGIWLSLIGFANLILLFLLGLS